MPLHVGGYEGLEMNLRPYQSAASDAIFKEWQENDSTLVVMPTGGGKTILFADGEMGEYRLTPHAVSAFTVASRLSTSATFNIWTPVPMRFIKPVSAVPGPSSMKRVKPCASR